MKSDEYDIGDRPVLTATFRDEDGVLTPMTAITFKILSPDNVETVRTIAAASSPSPGVYEWQIPSAFDRAGRWVLRAAGTSPIETAAELVVQVRKSPFN